MGESLSSDKSPVRRSPRVVLALLVAALAVIATESLFGEKVTASATRGPTPRVARPRQVPPRPAPAPTPAATPRRADPPPRVATAEPVDPKTLRVSRIVFVAGDEDASFAVIDERAVRCGDRIGGHRVHRVESRRVLLGAGGEIAINLEDAE